MKQNLYQPVPAEIVDVIDESPTIKSFVVVPEDDFSFDTGQLVHLEASHVAIGFDGSRNAIRTPFLFQG